MTATAVEHVEGVENMRDAGTAAGREDQKCLGLPRYAELQEPPGNKFGSRRWAFCLVPSSGAVDSEGWF